MSHISDLPIPSQLRFVKEAWEREKRERSKLNGRIRFSKMEEADMCLEAINNIEEKLITESRKG